MSRDEETALFQHLQNQDEQAEPAANRLIETTLRLVSSIAQRHSSAGIPVLDSIQKGNESLPVALKTFAGNSNDSFAIHAGNCIEQAILKFIAESKSVKETRS